MSLIISSGDYNHILKTIDNDAISICKEYLPEEEIQKILNYSTTEGIRCWGLNKSKIHEGYYQKIRPGFEILIKQNGLKKFTRYGIVIQKRESPAFAKKLWPDNDRQYVIFIANVQKVDIDIEEFLGLDDDLQGMRVKEYLDFPKLKGESISMHYKFPVRESVRNVKTKISYFAPNIPTQTTRRQGHQDFASTVKENYDHKCAICELSEREFLVAAHINRWADDEENRINPANGICLCTLHDRAFEFGYIGFDAERKVVLSPKINRNSPLHSLLKTHENTKLRMPVYDPPDLDFLKRHREKFGL